MRNAESASSKGSARFPASRASGPAARSTRSRTFPLIFRIVPANRRSRRAARKLPRCFWRKCKSRSFRAKRSAHLAICGFPTPRPLSALKKVCGASNVFSLALKPRSDCGVQRPSRRFSARLLTRANPRHFVRPAPTRIEPIFVPRIWGARSLAPLFPEKSNLLEPIGEVWLTGVDCRIGSGPFAGKTLGEAWAEMPAEWRGTRLASVKNFPLLVKFIFPNDKLSIQVHPDDAYASVHEKAAGGRGKTEMWHAVSAEAGAHVLIGLVPKADKERFLRAIETHSLETIF